jgi:CRP-like cAMP-binding protein
MMSVNQVQLLQQMAIFGGVRGEILEQLMRKTPTVAVAKGRYFFHEQDRAESMFVLETGKAAVLKHWDGQDYLLREIGPGACFGEMALIDLEPRSAAVLALENCTALEVVNSVLYETFLEDAEQFALIYMNIARELSRRLRDADNRWFKASFSGVPTGERSLFTPV